MRISDWSSDVCSSDLSPGAHCAPPSPASQERGFTDDQEETMERLEHRASFGGWQDVYRHRSAVLGCDMTLGVYFPPQAQYGQCPVLYWHSGLARTPPNLTPQAGQHRHPPRPGTLPA